MLSSVTSHLPPPLSTAAPPAAYKVVPSSNDAGATQRQPASFAAAVGHSSSRQHGNIAATHMQSLPMQTRPVPAGISLQDAPVYPVRQQYQVCTYVSLIQMPFLWKF